ncbi:MAG: FAD-binding oxidoreductase [Planctomycetes bacterium]|nr:FAD-binding oxidoreductase [Planctomycetota bacterium]NOG54281.1 FAD-binding protein [Planctomycetota bacterium]
MAVPTAKELQQHAEALALLVTGEAHFSRHDRLLYATDASLYQVEPLGIVIPRSISDVEKALHYCHQHTLPVLIRGGGTSLAGQCTNRAVVIDLSTWCARLLDIDWPHRQCRVEPGIELDTLNRNLRSRWHAQGARKSASGGKNGKGLWFAPDVATARQATIGGMINNNSAGTHSIRYGHTVDHVAGVQLLLADGGRLQLFQGAAERDQRVQSISQQVAEIVTASANLIRTRYPKITRRVNGYCLDRILTQIEACTPGTLDQLNLAHLICGSEGTLGVVTEATLNLVERPAHTGLALIAFDSLEQAVHAVQDLLITEPSAIELLDDLVMQLAAGNRKHKHDLHLMPTLAGRGKRRGKRDRPSALLYVEYFADSKEELAEKLTGVDRHFASNQLVRTAVRLCVKPAEIEQAWGLRKAGEPLLHGIPGLKKPITFVEDTAVSPEVLPDFVRDFRSIVETHGTRAASYAHASVGCLHVRPLLNLHLEADRRHMIRIGEEVCDLVKRYGGSLSGEHGDGRARSPLLERYFGPELIQVFKQIKAVFDPGNRLNPGNIVSPEPADIHLRVSPNNHPVTVPDCDTCFSYEDQGGWPHAMELCNGAGVCRKPQAAGGTMCPSYMATRLERDSSRGRANALRLAMTGQLKNDAGTDASPWNDPSVLGILKLCLSCKACKTECPSNVDVARYKAEYEAQSDRVGRRPTGARKLFGNVNKHYRRGAAMAPIANWFLNTKTGRGLINRKADIAPQRSLPRFSKPAHTILARKQGKAGRIAGKDAPTVLLYLDCFTAYTEPDVAVATFEVLTRLGYRVAVPRIPCCGRAMISQGLLDQAMRQVSKAASSLMDQIGRTGAVAVVIPEPSCLAAIHDEWQSLKNLDVGHEQLARLAGVCMLPEEFISRRWEDHPRPFTIDRHAPAVTKIKTVALHGHCHQKALWSTADTHDVLGRVLTPAGINVREMDTGCCGMAGAFGYQADHYRLSMQIGDLALFPQVRSFDPSTSRIVAPGTSCRQQILDGTGRHADHPIVLLNDILSSPS